MRSQLDASFQEGLHSLFYQHPEVTYLADVEGNLINYNDRLVELTGLSPDSSGKVAFTSLLHRADVDVATEEFAAAVSGESRSYRCRFVSKTGDLVNLAVTHLPVRDPAGDVIGVLGIARNLNDLLHAEQTKHQMETELQSTLDQMSIGITFLDRQWSITFANTTAKQHMQQTADVFGKCLWEVIPGLKDTVFGATYLSAMEHGEVTTTRAFSPTSNRWLEVTTHPTTDGLAIHTVDVTDDENAKIQLDQNAQDLRQQAALLGAARDAIYQRDLDGHITYWNASAERLFGWSMDEISGVLVQDVLPLDPDEFERATDHVMRVGHWSGQFEKFTKDGRILTLECRWQLIRDEAGAPESILSVDSDITEWKRGEEKRNQAQRLESLGTLASGIAHDFNNILTPILMSAQMLSSGETDANRVALYDSIESGVKRGADMVRQILSFARGEEAHQEPLEVTELIAQVQDFCRATLPKSIQLEIDASEDMWLITADKTQLFQVLVNLVTNAREAMPEGGVLTIHASNFSIGPSRHVAIEVEDTGCGMDAATAARTFEPFFTTRQLGGGTGLGLPTSATIIRNHGGDLDVYSEPGLGTRLRIRLPATLREDREEVAVCAATDLLLRGNDECILVVDDEATIRSIACQALEANGYRTIAAANGLEAVAIMERGEVAVDLLFTDMMMPEMGGAATAAYFLNNFPHIAVIATSGLNANDGVVRAAHSGVARFVSKPFTTTELLVSVRETLDNWGQK